MLVCNFEILKIDAVSNLIEFVSRPLKRGIDQLGTLMSSIILVTIIIILLKLLQLAVKKFKKIEILVKKLQQKLMWSSILRSLM